MPNKRALYLKKKEQKIKQLSSQLKRKPRILALISAGHGTYRVAGGDTGVQQMINLTGAENIFESQKSYKNINAEAMLQQNPDFIFIAQMGEDSIENIYEKFFNNPLLKAYFQKEQILSYDSMILFNMGVRSLDIAEEIIHNYLKVIN